MPTAKIPRRIVLTGGPGAGKTVVARDIVSRHAHRYVLVPEAATQVYEALQTRWDRLDLEGRRDVQRQIYRLQLGQEAKTLTENPNKILLLDRGTIDGAAYWPEGAAAYWLDLSTTLAAEIARYDAIIWMQTSAALGLYDGDASNACRFEHPQAAIESGDRLKQLWATHDRLRTVNAYPHFADKIAAVEMELDKLANPTASP
jgi:predicted ATPase